MERESVAALPITDYDHWWANQVNSKTRNLIRKAEKKGVEIRLARCDDHFVEGMTELFNESKYRQGKRFGTTERMWKRSGASFHGTCSGRT